MKTWKVNETAYDSHAKEFVLITNLRCPLCAKGDKAHIVPGVECATEPFEAIATRFVTLNLGKPVMGFTYRGVDANNLRETTHKFPNLDIFTKSPHVEFIGRL